MILVCCFRVGRAILSMYLHVALDENVESHGRKA